jgi:hypothetical protein
MDLKYKNLNKKMRNLIPHFHLFSLIEKFNMQIESAF